MAETTTPVDSNIKSQEPLTSEGSLLRRYFGEVITSLLLLIMAVNLFTQLGRKSITNDEVVHIPAGYRYLTNGDFRINPEHPPLAKMWAAVPLLRINPKLEPLADPDAPFEPLSISTSVKFWQTNVGRFTQISYWARVPMVILSLLLGVLIFVLGRQLFGARAAVIAVFLFSTEPTMLAHGTIVHTDMPAALASVLFVIALFAYLRSPSLLRAVGLGLATGIALVTKFSLLVVVPVFVAALGWTLLRKRTSQPSWRSVALQAMVSVVAALLMLNAAYRFQGSQLAEPDKQWITERSSVVGPTLTSLATKRLGVVPAYYQFGLYAVAWHNAVGHPTSLLGEYNARGWWYYFPVVFALKTSLPFLLLSIVGVCWCVWMIVVRRQLVYLGVLAPVIIYFAISSTSHINIGVRHLAPVFPFLFLIGGALCDRLLQSDTRRIGSVLGIVLFVWIAFVSIRTYPDYLSYANPLVLGRENWQVMSDSNVEWGADVGALAKYLKEHGETRVQAALLGGWVTLELYEVQYVNAFSTEVVPRTKYVAIGASFLNGSTVPAGLPGKNGFLTDDERVRFFEKYRQEVPVAKFGNSINLYLTKD